MRYNTHQAHFMSGELGDQFLNRVDTPEYKNGLQECENFFPADSGAMSFREGLQFKSRVATAKSRGYYPFVTNDGTEYLVVFSVGTYVSPVGQQYITATVYNSSVDDSVWATSSNIIDPTADFLTTSYLDIDVDLDTSLFHYCQIGEVLVLAHPTGTIPPILFYEKDGEFEAFFWGQKNEDIWNNREFVKSIAFNKFNTDIDVNFYFDAATSGTAYELLDTEETIIINACDASNSGIAVFTPDHEGAIYRIVNQTNQKETIIQIKDIGTSATSTTATGIAFLGLDAELVGTAKKSNEWAINYWNKLNGYPKTVTYYNQRLCFGGNSIYKDMLWFSAIGKYTQFLQSKLYQDAATDVTGLRWYGDNTNDNPFNVQIASSLSNYITFLASEKFLFVGTRNGEFFITPMDGVFGPSYINISKKSTVGSSSAFPVLLDDSIVFVSKDERKLYRYYLSDSLEFENLLSKNPDIVMKTIDSDVSDSLEDSDLALKKVIWSKSRNMFFCLAASGDMFYCGLFSKGISPLGRFYSAGSCEADGSDESTTPKVRDLLALGNRTFFVIQRTVTPYTASWASLHKVSSTDYDQYSLEFLDYSFRRNSLSNSSTNRVDKPIFLDSSSYRYLDTTDVGGTGRFYTTSYHFTFDDPHNVYLGQPCVFTTTGTLPTEIISGTTYYLSTEYATVAEANIGHRTVFYIYPTEADAIARTNRITFSTSGSGVITGTLTPADSSTTRLYWEDFKQLIGQDVSYLADGVYGTSSIGTDARGILTLDTAAREVIVGLPYEGFLKTMPIEGGAQAGVSRGNITRVDRINVSFYKTYSGKYGSDENDMRAIPFDGELFTGDKTLDFPVSPDRIINVMIKQDQPLPMTVLGMTIRGVSNEG